MIKKLLLIILIGFIFLDLSGSALAQEVRSSTAYKIQSDSLNFAGALSSSPSYSIEDTSGENATGRLTGTTYGMQDVGYQLYLLSASDTTPPSAPSSIAANPITSSRIELVWGDSTDNVTVDGFYIYRDGIRIASVSNFPRTYVDSSLSSDTSYSYNISAFDGAGNESVWSSTTTARTLTQSFSGGSSTRTPFITANQNDPSILIIPNDTKALVKFNTNTLVKAKIFWGKDNTYSDGTLNENLFSDTHEFVLENLSPSTNYFVKIILIGTSGKESIYEDVNFRTLTSSFVRSVPNVSFFEVRADINKINLSWALPTDASVRGVVLVKSLNFYPNSPTDGKIIYDSTSGLKQSNFIDSDVNEGVRYFYTIFTKDFEGNISSGVVNSARINLKDEPVATTTPLDNLPDASNVDPLINGLLLEDFLFIQNGESVDVKNNTFTLLGDQNTTFVLKYYRVPETLKTIAISLVTVEDEPKSFSFILKANQNKTRYESTIGPLGKNGIYKVKIRIIDFKNQGLKKIDGILRVVDDKSKPLIKAETKEENDNFILFGLTLVLILILIVSVLIAKRFFSKNPKKNYV